MGRGARHPGLHDASGAGAACAPDRRRGSGGPCGRGGEGPAVVMLHGFGDTADSWRRVVPRVARDNRAIASTSRRSGARAPPRNGTGLIEWYRDFFPRSSTRSASRASRSSATRSAARSRSARRSSGPTRVDRLALIAPAGLGPGAPWWWQAMAGQPGQLGRAPAPSESRRGPGDPDRVSGAFSRSGCSTTRA